MILKEAEENRRKKEEARLKQLEGNEEEKVEEIIIKELEPDEEEKMKK